MTTASEVADTLIEFDQLPSWKQKMAKEIVARMWLELALWPDLTEEIVADTRNALDTLRGTDDILQ